MDESTEEPPRAARAGRRARQAAFSQEDSEAPEQNSAEPGSRGGFGLESEAQGDVPPPAAYQQRQDNDDNNDEDESPPKPPPPRRGGFAGPAGGPQVGGYGVDNIPRPAPDPEIGSGDAKFVGVSRRKQDQRQREEEEKKNAKNKYDELVNRAGSIENIMEIEEEGREDLSNVVADAPKVRTNKVQNITDLDEDMHFRLPSTDDRDIDLSLLTAFLCSSEQVHEPDEAWDPDMLFTNVASELHHEKEKAEGTVEKDGKEGAAETSVHL